MTLRTLSTHVVEVVPVILEPHPNADALSIVRVFGYTVCVRTEDWRDQRLGAYIPPDSVCPDTPDFAFLGNDRRIRARRFRGTLSQGLLFPAPAGACIGDDVAATLGITHYEPPLTGLGGDRESPPPGWRPTYDVDSWYRYGAAFSEGEEVVVTEKVHGANARFTFIGDRMWCGSRNHWLAPDDSNLWWRALRQNPWIEELCRAHECQTLYAEVFGKVQDLHYGVPSGQYRVIGFDILRGGEWTPWHEIDRTGPLADASHWAPVLYVGPYSEERIRSLIDGPSMVSGAAHVREGIVIAPTTERTNDEVGRVKLKAVSADYLARTR